MTGGGRGRRPVSSLRNLGPRMEAAFARVGIGSAEELRALGADAAYLRLLDAGERPHFAAFWALVFALQDRRWTELGPEEKAALRARFEAVKARARPPAAADGAASAALEGALDRLGLAQPTSSRPEKK